MAAQIEDHYSSPIEGATCEDPGDTLVDTNSSALPQISV